MEGSISASGCRPLLTTLLKNAGSSGNLLTLCAECGSCWQVLACGKLPKGGFRWRIFNYASVPLPSSARIRKGVGGTDHWEARRSPIR